MGQMNEWTYYCTIRTGTTYHIPSVIAIMINGIIISQLQLEYTDREQNHPHVTRIFSSFSDGLSKSCRLYDYSWFWYPNWLMWILSSVFPKSQSTTRLISNYNVLFHCDLIEFIIFIFVECHNTTPTQDLRYYVVCLLFEYQYLVQLIPIVVIVRFNGHTRDFDLLSTDIIFQNN